jgi:hypothetical protein
LFIIRLGARVIGWALRTINQSPLLHPQSSRGT